MPATVVVTCTDGEGPYPAGVVITLQAEVVSGHADRWSWKRGETTVPGATYSDYRLTVGAETTGDYSAVAVVGTEPIASPPFPVVLKEESDVTATTPPATPQQPPEPAPQFHVMFAVITLLIALVVIGAVVWLLDLDDGKLGLSSAEWNALDARGKVGAAVLTPVVALGAIAVMIGMWMAIVEWRGRFAEKPVTRARGVDKIPAIIEAVGKLRGAALVMVVGALLMFAAAWITQSTADTPPASTTTTSTTTP